MKDEFELRKEIELRRNELKILEESLEVYRLNDWRAKTNKYWLVESYPVRGKTSLYIYHIIDMQLNKSEFEYVSITDGFISYSKYDFLIEPFCMKWTEVTKKDFEKECKKIEPKNDFRINERDAIEENNKKFGGKSEFCMKWTEVTKDFEKECKKIEPKNDFRIKDKIKEGEGK